MVNIILCNTITLNGYSVSLYGGGHVTSLGSTFRREGIPLEVKAPVKALRETGKYMEGWRDRGVDCLPPTSSDEAPMY